MKLQMIGCSYHQTPIDVRERLAFTSDQASEALDLWRTKFPQAEAVLLSTCNRVEIYTAAAGPRQNPTHEQVVQFMADYHGLAACDIFQELFERTGEDAVRHLFSVAASLDSMVVGEPQILAQVKQAYELACERNSAGPLTHGVFQAAARVARRVASETTLHQRRVSIPSVAVGDFASQIFERFDDKNVLVIGAGEMAEETLLYLQDAGARKVAIVNRNLQRAEQMTVRWHGRACRWEELPHLLVEADLIVSTTDATQPIVTLDQYRQVEADRFQRPLFILDLAIPRDFEPAIGDCLGVYLYSIDDLRAACQRNRAERDNELPRAIHIVEQETARFMQELHHRATAPIISRLRQGWQQPKEDELRRLFNKLPDLGEGEQDEIREAFDRLLNKLLHPPLESLRNEAANGPPHGLLDALKRLFRLED